MTLLKRPAFVRDLDHCAAYIAKDNPDAARRLLAAAESACESQGFWVSVSDLYFLLSPLPKILLTRARPGMVLFIPPGDSSDRTRLPEYYNSSLDYLRDLGIPEIR